MKYTIVLLLTCLLAGGTLTAQSKKDLEKSLNTEKAISDSLRKELKAATALLDSLKTNQLVSDSLSKSKDPYKDFYDHMYTKYLKASLANDSASLTVKQATAMVDSMVVARSSRIAKADTSMMHSRDTLARLQAEKQRAEIELESIKRIIAEATSIDRVPLNGSDFKGKWETYVVPLVVVGSSPQSAILSAGAAGLPDSLFQSLQLKIPRSIVFGDNDLAEITFMGGRTMNCFFKIIDYDPVKPFFIDLDRGDDLNVRMYAMNTNKGMQVSVEIPTGKDEAKRYWFGYMKR